LVLSVYGPHSLRRLRAPPPPPQQGQQKISRTHELNLDSSATKHTTTEFLLLGPNQRL
jgi:hypothetical protein